MDFAFLLNARKASQMLRTMASHPWRVQEPLKVWVDSMLWLVKEPSCVRTVPDASQAYVAPKKSNTSVAPIGRVSSMWKRDGRGRPLMSIRAQLTMFGGWSKDPCLRIFIRRMLGIQPCSMARFGRMFALGSGDGKTVPTKTSPSSLQRLWRTLSAEKKRRPLRFLTCPVKSTRAHFLRKFNYDRDAKPLWFFGMKWMMNSANVGTAGSINHRRDVYGIVLPTLIMARNHWTEHMDWNHQGQIFHDRSAPDFSHRSQFYDCGAKTKKLHLFAPEIVGS